MSHTFPPSFPESKPIRHPQGGLPPTDEYNALADLFLGEEAADAVPLAPPTALPSPTTSDAQHAPIEGLIVGHLPVLSAAWVQQYARHVSTQRSGPVGLIRLRAGEATLDLIGSREESAQLAPSLDAAIAHAAGHAAAWLIRVDETAEPRLLDMPGLSSITLMTGADQAAICSAYRTLKGLVRPTDDAPEAPELRFTIMGADPQKAAEASSNLERAAAAFLGRAIHVGSCISRIGGQRSVSLYRGPWTGTPEDLIRLIEATPRVAPSPAPARVVRHTPAPPLRQVAPPIPLAPTPEPVVSRLGKLQTSASPASLCSHLPSLHRLDMACPHALEVELAADEKGVIHLLSRHSDVAPLLTVASWVRSHHALIKAAAGAALAASEGAEPSVLHLFTDDPRRVRALGDSPVRLHLLAQVNADGKTVWYHTPLN